jgi:DNA repair exonuclease SbcCD nuclease subunit
MIITDDKLIIFSDFHWGKNKDSDLKLQGNVEFIDWMIEQAKEKNIKTLMFMGDWHDNRSSLSVKTYNKSCESIRKISNAGLTLYMIVGNHDAYYKDSIDTNSLISFNDIEGIHVITEPVDISFAGNNAVMVPWDTHEKITKTYDVMFGHFEFAGASFNNSMVCKHGISGAELTKIAPLVFSGHFHLRKEYPYKNGSIVTVGCPLQLDWGDFGDNKGMYILNSDLSYEFIENTVSPRYHKVKVSDIASRVYNFDNITGNYISLVVDAEITFDKIVALQNVIDNLNPIIPCTIEYDLVAQTSALTRGVMEDTQVKIVKSKSDQLIEYVNSAEDSPKFEGLKLPKLKDMLLGYYKEFENVKE